MSKRQSTTQVSRRGFLKGAATAGGAAAVSAIVSGTAQATPITAAQAATDQHLGYHETQHIRTYYHKARF